MEIFITVNTVDLNFTDWLLALENILLHFFLSDYLFTDINFYTETEYHKIFIIIKKETLLVIITV